jgi:hypothetical protein
MDRDLSIICSTNQRTRAFYDQVQSPERMNALIGSAEENGTVAKVASAGRG